MKTITSLLLFATVFNLYAQTCSDRGPNVILFTWDGVRNQEFFRGTGWLLERKLEPEKRGQLLEKFWNQHAAEGMVLGGNERYRIGSDIAISLPSYQAIMMGKSTGCKNNGCDSVKEETLMESLRLKLNLEKKDVAVFASWNRILAAVAANPDNIIHGIYPETFDDGSSDPVLKQIQQDSLADLPEWQGSRKDKYTFSLAMHYLKKHCPRFLYISLVDSDEFGHAGNYDGYTSSIRSYDGYLDELITFLKDSGAYGANTTLFVTTDHSRGPGPFWKGHAITTFSEKSVWLYARGRGVDASGRVKDHGNHVMLRPTIEALMGLPNSLPKLPGIKTE